MPRRNCRFNIDINNNTYSLSFTAKQYEDLELNIAVLDKNRPYDVRGCEAELYIQDRNGQNEVVSYMAEEVVGNDVVFKIDGNELLASVYEAEIIIKSSEGTFKTPTFYFNIERSLSGSNKSFTLLDSEGFELVDENGYTLQVRN